MHFKLIIAFVEDNRTNKVIERAKTAGATGVTVINNARGEGPEGSQSFFGLSLESQRDMLLFLVEEHLSRHILELIGEVGKLDSASGAGVAFQIDVEDAIGLSRQAACKKNETGNQPEKGLHGKSPILSCSVPGRKGRIELRYIKRRRRKC